LFVSPIFFIPLFIYLFIYCRNKKDCQWSPIDFSTDEPVRRHFRAQFSSEQAAIEFQKIVQEVSQ
jgi:hypothetical protein